MRSRRRKQQENEAGAEVASPPKPVVPEVNESHVIFLKNRAKSAGFGSIRAGLTKKEYKELLATSPIIHKPVKLTPLPTPEKPILPNTYSNYAPSINQPVTPPPSNESTKISIEIDSPYKTTSVSPGQQDAFNRTYSTIESTYSNDYEFENENEPNHTTNNKTNNNNNNEEEDFYEIDTNEYEVDADAAAAVPPEQTFHDEVIVLSLTDPIYDELQSDDLIGKRFGWNGSKSRDRGDENRLFSSGQGSAGGLSPEHGSSSSTFDRTASTEDHHNSPYHTSSSSRALTPTATNTSNTGIINSNTGNTNSNTGNTNTINTGNSVKHPRLHIVPSHHHHHHHTGNTPFGNTGNSSGSSGKQRPATAGNHPNHPHHTTTVIASGPTDYISGFDIEDPKYAFSIFENYSGLIYRDPAMTSTWKDPPDGVAGGNNSGISHTPLPFHSDKRSLHAGRMMNSYRPWGPDRPVDPLNHLISQTIAKAAAEEKKQSRIRAKEEAEKRKSNHHKKLVEEGDSHSLTSGGGGGGGGRRRMSRLPTTSNTTLNTTSPGTGTTSNTTSSTSPSRRPSSMHASSSTTTTRRPTTSTGSGNTGNSSSGNGTGGNGNTGNTNGTGISGMGGTGKRARPVTSHPALSSQPFLITSPIPTTTTTTSTRPSPSPSPSLPSSSSLYIGGYLEGSVVVIPEDSTGEGDFPTPPPPTRTLPMTTEELSTNERVVEGECSQPHTPKSVASWEYQQYNLGAILGDDDSDDSDDSEEEGREDREGKDREGEKRKERKEGKGEEKGGINITDIQQQQQQQQHPESTDILLLHSPPPQPLNHHYKEGEAAEEGEEEEDGDGFYEVSTTPYDHHHQYHDQYHHDQYHDQYQQQSNFPVLATSPIHILQHGAQQQSLMSGTGLPPIESPIQRTQQRKSCPVGIFTATTAPSANASIGSTGSSHTGGHHVGTGTAIAGAASPHHHHNHHPNHSPNHHTQYNSNNSNNQYSNSSYNNSNNNNAPSSANKRSALIINRITPRIRLHSM